MAATKKKPLLDSGAFSLQRPNKGEPNKVKQMTAGSEPEIMLRDDQLFDTPLNEGFDLEDIDSLAESMKRVGQLHAICVWEHEDGRYEIYSGCRRRYAWCRILGHKEIACKVSPYPADPGDRWQAHFDANRQTREKSTTWWYLECMSAQKVLLEKGIGQRGRDEDRINIHTILTIDEYMEKIGEMIGRSGRQVKRYLGVVDLTADIRDLEKYGLSGNTLILAKSLPPEKQKRVADLVSHEFAVNGEGYEISRQVFQRIVTDVATDGASRPGRRVRTYSEDVSAASRNLLKTIGKYKKKTVSRDERERALAEIVALRSKLDELEAGIRDVL